MIDLLLADLPTGAAAPVMVQHTADSSMVIVVGAATVLLSLVGQGFALLYTRREAEAREKSVDHRLMEVEQRLSGFLEKETGKAHIEARLGKLEESLTAFVSASSESRRLLYQHVDQVREALSRKADDSYRDLVVQIANTPAKVIAMLKDTNSLRE
jgi:hypothetical protein